jgi:capsular exopolysaccharide synthesis family protein
MKQIPEQKYLQPLPLEYYYPSPQEEKEVHLRDYWKVLKKRRWLVLAFFLIVVVTTAIGTLAMRPIFRGTTTIQINKENPQIVEFKEVFTINTADMDYYQTQYKILESRSLARRVIQTLNLSDHSEFLAKPESSRLEIWKSRILAHFPGWLAFLNPEAKDPSANREETARESSLINQFLDRLKVEPIRNSRLVKIHFDSHYSDLSPRVSTTLAEMYIQQNLEARFTATEQAKDWLARQLNDLKAKVERADEILQAFGSKHDIISLEERENIIMRRLTDLNEALTKSESERMAKESLYKQIQNQNLDSLPTILENKLIQEMKQASIQLEAEYMKLSQKFQPEYPDMKRLKYQIETIQQRIQAEISKIVAGIKNEYEASLRKESLLRMAFEDQKAKALEMKQKSIQYNILKREADTNKELYRALLQRMKEAGVSAGITASNIQVVDRAEIPTKPFKPDKKLNLILAAIVGLFLGVGLAFFVEYFDNTVKMPEDVEELIRLPSLGIVPEISYDKRKQVESGNSFHPELVTFLHPKSIFSEAYRSIRTSILLSFSGKPPKTLVLSSPSPAEGKTTTAINTAIALSQTGAQVLVIDADMRKPKIHQIFGKENGAGLSSFLSGNSGLRSVIRNSQISNLYYIPAGPIPPNPSELLGSSLFKNTIQFLGELFDHILIDSPPLLGFADSIILSTVVDGVIVVVTGGKTSREELQRAKDALLQVDGKIIGVVINRVDLRRNDYGSYYHKYYYYYGNGKRKKRELPVVTGEQST